MAPHAFYHNWQVLTETDENGAAQRWFIYGNYIDEVLVMVAEGTPDEYYYYAHDHLFSTVALMEDDGDVVERYEYDAYGKMTRYDPDFTEWSGTEAGNPYYFTGRRVDVLEDGDLTLQYSRNRYYDYHTGRWLTHDSLGITLTLTNLLGISPKNQYKDGLCLYKFLRNNPTKYIDSYGNLTCTWREIVREPSDMEKDDGYIKKFIRGRTIYAAGWCEVHFHLNILPENRSMCNNGCYRVIVKECLATQWMQWRETDPPEDFDELGNTPFEHELVHEEMWVAAWDAFVHHIEESVWPRIEGLNCKLSRRRFLDCVSLLFTIRTYHEQLGKIDALNWDLLTYPEEYSDDFRASIDDEEEKLENNKRNLDKYYKLCFK